MRLRLIILALLLSAFMVGSTLTRVEADGQDRYFAVSMFDAVPGSLNPKPVECDAYAVYNGVLEFSVTGPDEVRRIVFAVPLTNVRSYYEYGYPGY